MRLFTRILLPFILLFLAGTEADAQLVAGFTASPISGCAPLVVCFHNTTTPTSGTTYDWDFGNSTPIVHLDSACTSYPAAGTYTVTLTAHNGGATSTHTQVINVYPSPVVNFTASILSACPGAPVTFTSTTSGGVPGPVSYTWAFGDGLGTTGDPVTHAYTVPGEKNVTLTAKNADGCIASLTKPLYLNIFTPPVAGFTASTTAICNPPGSTTFTSTSTGTGPFTYTWRFGDGSPTSSATSPTHTYTSPGSYAVTLVVTDSNGCEDSVTVPAYITVGTIHAAFTGPATACLNTVVNFLNTSSPHIGSEWTYGDGHSGGTDNGINVYTTPGTYNVTLIIFNGACYDTVTHPITILPEPIASFTITPAEPCPAPATATFTATVPPGSTVTWHYGDGTSGAGAVSTHTYAADGCFTVSMIVTTSAGCLDTFVQTYCIYDLQFGISHSIDTAGCAPLTVHFATWALTSVPGPGLTFYPYPIASYSWDFGDGSPGGSGATPIHTYTAPGIYNAVVTILTANGCPATASITILVGTPPVISVTAAPRHLCYHNNIVTFTATIISGPVDAYDWQFGDGTGQATVTPTVTHHYVLPGLFTVTVTPYYHGCEGPQVILTDYILIDSPMSIIKETVLCSPVNTVVFGDSSLGDDSHLWIFGDGSATSTLDNPTHLYPAPVVYTATLTTYNNASGCRDTATASIDLHRPVPAFTTPDTAICRDSFILFTSSVSGGTASLYYWHSSGRSADSTSPTYLDTFHHTGIYTIQLTIMDQNGCFDSAVRTNYILVAKPVASFTATPPNGCWPLTTVLTNSSTDVAGTFYTNFKWVFGDGDSVLSTALSITHTYTLTGSFTPTMTVTDNIGCKDTIALPLITVWRPAAAFTVSTAHPCLNQVDHFNNTSGAIVSSYWWFGDGDTSTLTNPTHIYTATGLYTVKLAVTDAHGCTDTLTNINLIDVTHPHAAFSMSDSVSLCPPLTVVFTNLSSGATAYFWKLGDGSTSVVANPTNLYIAAGLDTVIFVAKNTWGCTDTAIGHVQIFGYSGEFSYAPDSGCSPLTVHFLANTVNVPSITWDFADGHIATSALSDSISHVYTIPGAYVPKLILSNNTGCQNSALGADTIKVDGIAAGFTTIPNPVCLGESINLKDTSGSFWSTVNSWSWTYKDSTSTLPSPSVTYTAVGTYPVTLVVTDGWGCSAVVNQNVLVWLPPVITVSPDTIICVGDAATLYGYGGVSYTWAGPGTISCTACNPSKVSPIVVSQYTVTGTDAHGCKGWDTTSVMLKTLTVAHAWGDTAICFGKFAQLYDSGGTKYTWLPDIGLSDYLTADPLASPSNTVTYMAIAQLASCAPDTNYVTVVIYPLPTVNAGPDQTLLAGSVAQLTATGNLINNYLWTPGASLNCDTCYNPQASMSVTTTYSVLVTSIHGCVNTDTVTIHLFCDNSQMFVPNAFTPNGDGSDDVFYPRGQGVSIIKSFRIYNRWGEKLFERTNIKLNDESNAWDGSFNGGTPRPDVYVWVIDGVCETGEPLFLKGDVTIIR